MEAPRRMRQGIELGQLSGPSANGMLPSAVDRVSSAIGAATFVVAHDLWAHRAISQQCEAHAGRDAPLKRLDVDSRNGAPTLLLPWGRRAPATDRRRNVAG